MTGAAKNGEAKHRLISQPCSASAHLLQVMKVAETYSSAASLVITRTLACCQVTFTYAHETTKLGRHCRQLVYNGVRFL